VIKLGVINIEQQEQWLLITVITWMYRHKQLWIHTEHTILQHYLKPKYHHNM